MRIAIVQDHLRNGGTERQSLFIASFLCQSGHDVLLLIFRPGGTLAPMLETNGVVVRALQPIDSGLNFWAPGLLRTLRAWAPETILCMGRMANAYGWRMERTLKIPVVGSVRTGKPLPWHNLSALRRVSAVVVNTSWWAQRLPQIGVAEERVHLIPNALTRFWADRDTPAERERLRRHYAAAKNTCVLVCVAGFRPGKRHAWLLERFAALDLPDAQLWLVGDGEQRAYCQSLADRLGLSGRVKFPGYVADPYEWLAGADLAVSASIEDAQPNFLVEAQWLGLPCVAVNYRGVAECFEAGKGGLLVEPNDAAGFEAGIHRLTTDERLRLRMGAAAARQAHARFDATANAQAYVELFRHLSSRP